MPEFNSNEWIALATTYGVRILLALAIYLVGKRIVAFTTDLMAKAMTARGLDPTVGNFVQNITYYLLLALVVVAALGQRAHVGKVTQAPISPLPEKKNRAHPIWLSPQSPFS